MQEIIDRHLTNTAKRRLQDNPVVAILGPRQCGKTTLAAQLVKPPHSKELGILTTDDGGE